MTKLTKKGKVDKRSETSSKNIQNALVTRKKIFAEYNEAKKGKKSKVEEKVEDEPKYSSSESEDSSDSEAEIVITSRKRISKDKKVRQEPEPQTDKYDAVFKSLQDEIAELKKAQAPKEKEFPKPEVVKEVVREVEKESFDSHMKKKILNF